jgi:hypothetical protein
MEVTQMVKDEKEHSEKIPAKQGCRADSTEPYTIGVATPFDFGAKNLTPYGGLFPVATMLEKLGFQKLVEETLTIPRMPRVMTIYQFLLGMVLALYLGFSRLNQLRFVAQDPLLLGILKVKALPPQCTFWRFLTSLPQTVAQQLMKLQRLLRERVWETANVQLPAITLDTDTTVHTLYGKQMAGARATTRRTRGRKATSRLSPLSPRRGNIWAGSCATEIGPRENRLHAIWRACARLFLDACARFTRGPTRGSIAGRRWKPTRS